MEGRCLICGTFPPSGRGPFHRAPDAAPADRRNSSPPAPRPPPLITPRCAKLHAPRQSGIQASRACGIASFMSAPHHASHLPWGQERCTLPTASGSRLWRSPSAPNAPRHAPAEVFVPHTSASPCHLQATSKERTSITNKVKKPQPLAPAASARTPQALSSSLPALPLFVPPVTTFVQLDHSCGKP